MNETKLRNIGSWSIEGFEPDLGDIRDRAEVKFTGSFNDNLADRIFTPGSTFRIWADNRSYFEGIIGDDVKYENGSYVFESKVPLKYVKVRIVKYAFTAVKRFICKSILGIRG